jgi:GT2 family glycosyltransferase
MVGGKVLRRDGRTIDSTGLFLSVWRTAEERGYGRIDRGRYEKDEFIFGVSGAAALYKKDMLESIKEKGNYFDPRFKMFYEDLDISWRANKLGWKAYYTPKAIAYHVRGGSCRNNLGIDKVIARRYLNDELNYELIKNRYLTIIKNESFLGFVLHLIWIVLYDLLAWSYVLFFCPKVVFLFINSPDRPHQIKLTSGRKNVKSIKL